MRPAWPAAFGLALLLAAPAFAHDDDPSAAFFSTAPRLFKICTEQTYALCATASCFVLDGLSYCKCDVKSGDSISLPFNYGRNQDVCTVNAEGKKNGYMVSTYSLPESTVAPGGDQALYDCPAGTSNGAYAQCDGGVLYRQRRPVLPRVRQAAEEKRDHLLVPDHQGEPVGDERLSDRRPLPMRAILLSKLQESLRQRPDWSADLCRRPDRHGPLLDPSALRLRPAAQRMPTRVPPLERRIGDRQAWIIHEAHKDAAWRRH
jgi:hypothetical protein